MMARSTIYALASGRLPAAIAVVRVSGPRAHEAGTRLAGSLPEPRRAAVRILRSITGDVLDEALLLRFDGPGSATGEDVVELHCHGSRAVVEAVLGTLQRFEALRPAEPGEFTRRAFENGRIDLTEAEGLADLLEAETESQRKSALAMAEGGLRRQAEGWREHLLQLSARAEVAIDYVDEDGVVADAGLAADCRALATALRAWLDLPRAEALRDGIRVVLAGPPNSGKSSLFNAIVGSEKAIVTSVPGTTRDRLEAPIAIGGIPFVLVDTAGLRDSPDVVETLGIARAQSAIESADILLWLGDPDECPPHPRAIKVHARADFPGRGKAPTGSFSVSVFNQVGIAELIRAIAVESEHLLPSNGAVALNKRQAAALTDASNALERSGAATDIVIVAEELRSARVAFERLTGRAGVEDLLDALFGRFCLGK